MTVTHEEQSYRECFADWSDDAIRAELEHTESSTAHARRMLASPGPTGGYTQADVRSGERHASALRLLLARRASGRYAQPAPEDMQEEL